MRQIQPDLWETQVETPLPGLTTHAYLLIREHGNVLFYNSGLRDEIEKMAELGGVGYHYLSHRDEIGETLNLVAQRYGSKLGAHVAERAEVARIREPDILVDRRGRYPGDVEAIPTPGHSPGSTCFLVSSPHGKRYLFTGDTLYRAADGGWKPGFIPGFSRVDDISPLARSLELLRGLEPDVVIGSAFGGQAGFEELSPEDWPGRVDFALEALSRLEVDQRSRSPG
ncbi:MAG: MBL fold metallo-hydrolase [Gammaproteobacteria bacterium]|nr:MBL fold metallo-hydrolase [Gammaproteobacteria bacterium]